MNLLQINVLANRGSTGKIAGDIGSLALERGWRSVIAYGQRANPSKSELIRVGSDWDFGLHLLEGRLLDRQGRASRRATRRFLQEMDALRPDIVHLHNFHGYFLNYPLLFEYLAARDIPVVWTLHDCWPFTGHCAWFEFAGCERWKTGCHAPCPCKGDYPKSLLWDASKQNYALKKRLFPALKNATLVPVSDWLDALVKQSFLQDYPSRVIHNGIDLDLFRPQAELDAVRVRYGLQGKTVLLGVALIWEERKGLKDFIALQKRLPEDTVIVLVGLNAKQLATLPAGIVGIARTQNQQELAQLYSLADMFLNLTYEDNYPTTNLEALACGTPVLTYRTGGSPEAVSPETGWVLEQGDVAGVAEVVRQLKTRVPEAREAQRKACRQRAEEHFDKNACFARYFDLYQELLQGR